MALHPEAVDSQIRDVLEARRRELTKELARLVARLREHGAKPAPCPDSAEVDTLELDTSLVDLTNAMLRRIDAALERLDDGRYGRCTRCGGAIAEARLRAMPFAVRCRPCETARERKACSRRSTLRRRLWDEPLPAGGQSRVDEL